jgi:hypothetical protein
LSSHIFGSCHFSPFAYYSFILNILYVLSVQPVCTGALFTGIDKSHLAPVIYFHKKPLFTNSGVL